MFHIVFDSRGAEMIRSAMDMDEALDGEPVVIQDDFSVGPLADLFDESGRRLRNEWWSQIRAEKQIVGEAASVHDDPAVLANILRRMQDEIFDQIWIWVAPNAKDICGYYWLISQLREFSGRVYIISLNNLPFISEKGTVFYPASLSEIPPREFVKAKKLARVVSAAEFETDPDEWLRLASENKNLRRLEGGKKILQVEEDHYDKALFPFLQPAFQKIQRVIHLFLQKSQEKPNIHFLEWRIKKMIDAGRMEQTGDMVRLPAGQTETVGDRAIL